jgi:hypothetical protein
VATIELHIQYNSSSSNNNNNHYNDKSISVTQCVATLVCNSVSGASDKVNHNKAAVVAAVAAAAAAAIGVELLTTTTMIGQSV